MTLSTPQVADVLERVAAAMDRSIIVIHYEFRDTRCSQHIIDPGKFQDALREAARSAGGGVQEISSVSGAACTCWYRWVNPQCPVHGTPAAPAPAATTPCTDKLPANCVWRRCVEANKCCGVSAPAATTALESAITRTTFVPETSDPTQPGREPESREIVKGMGFVDVPVSPPTPPDAAQGKAMDIAGEQCGLCGQLIELGQPVQILPSAQFCHPACAALVTKPAPQDNTLSPEDRAGMFIDWCALKGFGLQGWPLGAYEQLVAHIRGAAPTPGAPPAQGEGRTSTWTDRPTCAGCGAKRGDPECHVCGEEAARDALEKLATLPMFAPPTPAVPESGLRECPHCHGRAIEISAALEEPELGRVGDNRDHWVYCTDCPASMNPLPTKAAAIAAWNTRAPSSAQAAVRVGEAEIVHDLRIAATFCDFHDHNLLAGRIRTFADRLQTRPTQDEVK